MEDILLHHELQEIFFFVSHYLVEYIGYLYLCELQSSSYICPFAPVQIHSYILRPFSSSSSKRNRFPRHNIQLQEPVHSPSNYPLCDALVPTWNTDALRKVSGIQIFSRVFLRVFASVFTLDYPTHQASRLASQAMLGSTCKPASILALRITAIRTSASAEASR